MTGEATGARGQGVSNTKSEVLYRTLLKKVDSLLVTYSPVKKITKNKLKFKDKPCRTSGLQKSTSIKNHYLSKFIRLKGPSKKEEAQIKCEKYRNLSSTLLK